jgi:hypothetical protein
MLTEQERLRLAASFDTLDMRVICGRLLYGPPPVIPMPRRTVVRQCLVVCGLGAIPYIGLLLLLS